MKRFYKDVAVANDLRILLDGKPVKTPARNDLLPPTRALADAIAAEWAAQGEEVQPASMPLLRFANTALDGVRNTRSDVIAAILRFGTHDLLCYRADAAPALADRQRAAWDPMLAWAAQRHGALLSVTDGIEHVEQPAQALRALEAAIAAHDDFALTGLHVLASITGSLVLGLALVEGEINPAQAFQLSRLDEDYQAQTWGEDAQARDRANHLAHEMDMAARFIALSRPQ